MEYFHSVREHQNTVHLVKEDTSQSNLHKHQCKTPQQHSENHDSSSRHESTSSVFVPLSYILVTAHR